MPVEHNRDTPNDGGIHLALAHETRELPGRFQNAAASFEQEQSLFTQVEHTLEYTTPGYAEPAGAGEPGSPSGEPSAARFKASRSR